PSILSGIDRRRIGEVVRLVIGLVDHRIGAVGRVVSIGGQACPVGRSRIVVVGDDGRGRYVGIGSRRAAAGGGAATRSLASELQLKSLAADAKVDVGHVQQHSQPEGGAGRG